jgi:hypothetical protein
MTWAAAKTRDLAGLREALFARRTVCFFRGNLIGSADLLKPIFSGAVRPSSDTLRIRGGTRGSLLLRNGSGLAFRLRLKADPGTASLSEFVDLPADRSALVGLRLQKRLAAGSETVRVSCTAENLWTGPGRGLETEFALVCVPAGPEQN